MSLPNEYIELEYIESSGTQYINLNNNQIYSDKLEYEFEFNASELVGGFGADQMTHFIINSTNGCVVGEWQRLRVLHNANGNTTIYNNDEQKQQYNTGTNYNNIPMCVLARGRTSTIIDNYTKGKLRYFKLYKNDTLIRDLVPSIRKTDLAIGLYDLVNDVFYTNSGSGVFTGKFKENPQPSSKPFDIVFFYPNGTIQYDVDKAWDYNEKKLFDTWEMLSNVQIVKQDEDTNVVAIYNQDGTTLRGAYTILNDGTIEQITDGVAIPNRVGSNKTKYVFDSNNNVLDLAKANLPNLQYNHKITFNINFDGEYKFDDFNLAQPIKFYSTKDNTLFNSILTAWKYEISQNSDVIQNATFTLGKVRDTLTDKVMKIRNNRS